MIAKRETGGELEYPSVMKAMESAGIHPIGVYINIQQTTIAERLVCRPVYALHKEADRMLGMTRFV